MHGKIYNNITELIGRTPLVRLNRIVPEGAAEVVAKLELTPAFGSQFSSGHADEQ